MGLKWKATVLKTSVALILVFTSAAGHGLASLGARDAVRLEVGLCLYGIRRGRLAVDDEQEATRGGAVCGRRVDGQEGLDATQGMRILDAEKRVVEMTSGSFSPCLQVPIAMRYL